MRILLVSGGLIPIPPTGWGAVEHIIWQQKQFLEARGHTVDILNAARKKTIAGIKAHPWKYDIVHLQMDSMSEKWVKLSRLFRFRLLLTSHYGYAAFPEKWDSHGLRYSRTFEGMLKTSYQIALSPEIRDVLLARGYKGRLWVLPNGVDIDSITFTPCPSSSGAVVLGRIEERKKQRVLAEMLRGHPEVRCDLIGPRGDGVSEEWNGNGENVLLRGQWTREQVRNHLTEYAALVLLSDGEAHALVLLEAMAAGLSLVISPECAHNLDTSLPFIYVVDRDKADLAEVIGRAVRENSMHRQAIRDYCRAQFDWQIIAGRYEAILKEICQKQ